MEIKRIEIDDIEPMVELARAMMAEGTEYKNAPFEADVIRTWFFDSLHRPDWVFCAAAKTDAGELAGGILGAKGPFAFSSKLQAFEIAFYVYPQFRGSSAFLDLAEAFDAWATAQRCIMINSGATIGIDDARAIRLYERRGFRNLGAVMRKDIPHVE